MKQLLKHFDLGSWIVILITLILFIIALFVTGLTHEVLLEVAVFLVSAKLIKMAHWNSVQAEVVKEKLGQIQLTLERLESHQIKTAKRSESNQLNT